MRANVPDWMERSRIRAFYMSRPPADVREAAASIPGCKCGSCRGCVARSVLAHRSAPGGDMHEEVTK